MEGLVNLLGFVTALLCSIILYRAYRRSRGRLLWWGAICFLALSIESLLVFVDLFMYPETDLVVIRHSVAVAGIAAFNFGLIWESS